jgi:hypothetical protein
MGAKEVKNSRQKQEKEHMEKYGGVIFVVSKKEHFLKAVGNENSAMLYDDETQGYKSNWFEFNMDSPVFPLLFIGGTMGLAISKILTFIPQGVGVTAGMAGVACAVFPIPLTIALLLGLLGGQPDLLPVIVIGAVTGFIISKALTPYLPKRGVQSAASGGKSQSQARS